MRYIKTLSTQMIVAATLTTSTLGFAANTGEIAESCIAPQTLEAHFGDTATLRIQGVVAWHSQNGAYGVKKASLNLECDPQEKGYEACIESFAKLENAVRHGRPVPFISSLEESVNHNGDSTVLPQGVSTDAHPASALPLHDANIYVTAGTQDACHTAYENIKSADHNNPIKPLPTGTNVDSTPEEAPESFQHEAYEAPAHTASSPSAALPATPVTDRSKVSAVDNVPAVRVSSPTTTVGELGDLNTIPTPFDLEYADMDAPSQADAIRHNGNGGCTIGSGSSAIPPMGLALMLACFGLMAMGLRKQTSL